MIYSQEKVKELKSKIRRLLVIRPEITCREIGETLKIDKNYANKLLNKIRDERAKRMDFKTVNMVLAEFEDLMGEGDKRMWSIIRSEDKKITAKDKIFAWRSIRENNVALFDKMFDAGVFERQLGKIKKEEELSPEVEAEIEKALNYVFHKQSQHKDNTEK